MTSNEVVKSVAKKLKYYFEVKRLEDGFDLSDIHQPQLDHPPLKADLNDICLALSSIVFEFLRPALQYAGLHDRALKHYFSQPDIKVQLTQMNGGNGKGGCFGKKEAQVRRMLDAYMKHYSFQAEIAAGIPKKNAGIHEKNTLPSCYSLYCSKGCPQKLEPRVLNRSKKNRNLIGGWPVLRSVPDQHISKGEAARLVNSATKILVAADLIDNVNNHNKEKKKEKRQSAPRSFESLVKLPSLKGKSSDSKRGSRRPATAKFSWDNRPKRASSPKRKAYDDSYIDRRSKTPEPKPRSPRPKTPPRPSSPSPSQSTVTTTTGTSVSTVTRDNPISRPLSAKYRSRTIINVPEPRQQEEVAVIRATQTVADYDVGSQTDRQLLDRYDQLEEEVTEGPWCEYQVYVCTGDRIGASTKAAVKFTIYGDKGRTKEFTLSDSKRHKIAFQKGKEDLFILAAHHVGRMRKIKIGHDRPELSYAWYCEGVTVYDMSERRIFQFPCERWLSGQDGDKRTYRTLQVDRERAFLDELEPEKAPAKHTYSESDNSSTLNEDLRYNIKGHKAYSTRVRRGDDSSDSDSESTSESSEASRSGSGSSSSHRKKAVVKADGSSPRNKNKGKKKTVVKDDYEEKARAGTVITLHGEDSKQIDEIHMGQRGRDVKTADEYVAGYKAGITASELETKKRLEREREMERSILQGKSIHDAVRDGDLERVKDLLHHFPEMKDFRDESSWTPLHLAAAQGNVDLLRWLVTSDADINAETSTGYNAIHIAAMNGHVNSMMLLQAMGSLITGLTSEKQSALHIAAKSGHLECVKWLVANRAHIQGEDNFGRTPMELANQFGHEACADFLRVCLKELSNPRSTFALIHGKKLSGGNLPPIEEDTASGTSSGSPWKDDTKIRGHQADSDSEKEENRKKTEAEERELEEKRNIYAKQQQQMEVKGYSFLDSIRSEVDDP